MDEQLETLLDQWLCWYARIYGGVGLSPGRLLWAQTRSVLGDKRTRLEYTEMMDEGFEKEKQVKYLKGAEHEK